MALIVISIWVMKLVSETTVLTQDTNQVGQKIKTFDWSDCGGPNATVRWEDVQIHEPIRLKNFLVGARYKILEEVQPGSSSKIELWRVMKVLFVPIHIKIPCKNKFGSCEYDICQVSQLDTDNFCHFQREFNASCGCPMKPKIVEGYNFKIKVPEQKFNSFQSLFVEGLYRIRWTWLNPKGEKIGCIEGQGNLIPNMFQ